MHDNPSVNAMYQCVDRSSTKAERKLDTLYLLKDCARNPWITNGLETLEEWHRRVASSTWSMYAIAPCSNSANLIEDQIKLSYLNAISVTTELMC
jgi:hypothetical protein